MENTNCFTKISEREIKYKLRGFKCLDKVNLVAAIIDESRVIIYRLSLEIVHVISLPNEPKVIKFIEWSPDGEQLAILCVSGEIYFSLVDTGKIISTCTDKFPNAGFIVWLNYDNKDCDKMFPKYLILNKRKYFSFNKDSAKPTDITRNFDHTKKSILLIGTEGLINCYLYGKIYFKVELQNKNLLPIFAEFVDDYERLIVVGEHVGERYENYIETLHLPNLPHFLPILFRIAADKFAVSLIMEKIKEAMKTLASSCSGHFSQLETVVMEFFADAPSETVHYTFVQLLLFKTECRDFLDYLRRSIGNPTNGNKFASNLRSVHENIVSSVLLLFMLTCFSIMKLCDLKAFVCCELEKHMQCFSSIFLDPVNDSLTFGGIFYVKIIQLLYLTNTDIQDDSLFLRWLKTVITMTEDLNFEGCDKVLDLIDQQFEDPKSFPWKYTTRVSEFLSDSSYNWRSEDEVRDRIKEFLPRLLLALRSKNSPLSELLSSDDLVEKSIFELLEYFSSSLEMVFFMPNFEFIFESSIISRKLTNLKIDQAVDKVSRFSQRLIDGKTVNWVSLVYLNPLRVIFVSLDETLTTRSLTEFPEIFGLMKLPPHDFTQLEGSKYVVVTSNSNSTVLTKIDLGDYLSSGGFKTANSTSCSVCSTPMDRLFIGNNNTCVLMNSSSNYVVTLTHDVHDS